MDGEAEWPGALRGDRPSIARRVQVEHERTAEVLLVLRNADRDDAGIRRQVEQAGPACREGVEPTPVHRFPIHVRHEQRPREGRVGFPLEHWPEHWWLAAFEPSVAAGAIRFLGDDFGEWRLTLSPEITIKPLKFIPAGKARTRENSANKKGDWRGLIEIAYGAVLIVPKIDNEDLHVTTLEPFEHGWLQRAAWIRVNASELFGLR